MARIELPIALTIAGSDSGGGAGIQADLKTFEGIGVHGICALTCITAQNPRAVLTVQRCTVVQQQLDAVFEELPPQAVKTGMLFSASTIHVVARYFRTRPRLPLVVDPVMVASSGAVLLSRAAQLSLKQQLLPLASLMTPNVPEAESLLGRRIRSLPELRDAARQLFETFGRAVLAKGGHLRATAEAIDVYFDGREEFMLAAPRTHKVRTHGTGCTYSAAITAFLALGWKLPEAVQEAKRYITTAIRESRRAGRHPILFHRQPIRPRKLHFAR